MAVWGIARVKDEADIIGYTAEHMLGQVDRLLICDNGSTDGTSDLLADLQAQHGLRVVLDRDDTVGYYQARAMTELARRAYGAGAEWVVPFDADEAWVAADGRPVRELLLELPDDVVIVEAQLFDHVATGLDDDVPNPLTRIGWRRRTATPLPKIAARASAPVRIHQGNHNADYGGRAGGLVVRHFPYRSPEQMVHKAVNGAAAYAATDLPDNVGKHWRDYGAIVAAHGPERLHDVFRAHFWAAEPTARMDLIFDPCPTSR